MVDVTPFAEASWMDRELDLLAGGTGECGIGFGAEVALTVSMEEGDVSD